MYLTYVQRHTVDVTIIFANTKMSQSSSKTKMSQFKESLGTINQIHVLLRSSLWIDCVSMPAFYFYDVDNEVGLLWNCFKRYLTFASIKQTR